ncbi:hypothetical protein XELAEV_18029261mg [Xenopus laevis]|uniref:Uncharacterized protein n=1 Tax=Xenopus laevis TaxID=8355 RepID=A0A974HHL0_XENLA|nr:hypothetical protein XELAEV_18029261mg [Xenopus laevis]
MVLGTTHKRHMIPAPPAVTLVSNTDATQSRHHILRKQHALPPLLPLIQCGALIVGANTIAFKGSSEGNSLFRVFLPSFKKRSLSNY